MTKSHDKIKAVPSKPGGEGERSAFAWVREIRFTKRFSLGSRLKRRELRDRIVNGLRKGMEV
jgi:hypothetical protein